MPTAPVISTNRSRSSTRYQGSERLIRDLAARAHVIFSPTSSPMRGGCATASAISRRKVPYSGSSSRRDRIRPQVRLDTRHSEGPWRAALPPVRARRQLLAFSAAQIGRPLLRPLTKATRHPLAAIERLSPERVRPSPEAPLGRSKNERRKHEATPPLLNCVGHARAISSRSCSAGRSLFLSTLFPSPSARLRAGSAARVERCAAAGRNRNAGRRRRRMLAPRDWADGVSGLPSGRARRLAPGESFPKRARTREGIWAVLTGRRRPS